MKRSRCFIFAFSVVLFLSLSNTFAQFPIKIPKLPKVEKSKQAQPKAEQPKTDGSRPTQERDATPTEQTKSPPQNSDSKKVYDLERPTDKPAFIKDSLYIQAVTHKEYWKLPKENKYSSWVPKVRFDTYVTNGGSALNFVAEYFNPDGSLWFSEPLEIGVYADDRTVSLSSDRTNTTKMLETKSSAGVGTYGIKITNKDTGEIVFQGKFKVGKFLPPYGGKNEFDFFVEHDWLLPMGYVGFHHSSFNDDSGRFPVIISVWMKGDLDNTDLEARVFYKNQQIASTKDDGDGSGVGDSGKRASENAIYSAELHHWKLWDFEFGNLRYDNGGSFNRDYYPNAVYADKNLGEYTVKIFHKNVQVRELKFTVGADGRLADGGFAKQIFLPYHKIIVPVKIIGTSEKWNASAWKADAFYGNPLTGFTVQ